MYFKRIDMHGFKSFAEPVSIDFHEGITCIVGPNGSGKSNISDAIRWVLGEQSAKMLRGGKMEEVIFSGTASRKSRGMAEVTLVLDNIKGILPIDFTEVAITRRMYRSGESEYYINNNACRLKDIRELIMDTGIGVDGYSIIGQGKISDIVGNKPESRREIFEEAAGIVKYRTKKAEAERKLESTLHNLERVNDIASEIESRIDSLKADSEKATEYLSLRDRYKTMEINLTLRNIESVELKNEYMKDDLLELDGQIDQVKSQRSAIDEDLTENRDRNDELDRLGAFARDQLLLHVEEISALINSRQLNQEKRATSEREALRLSEEISLYEDKIKREALSSKERQESSQVLGSEIQKLNLELSEKLNMFTMNQERLNELERNLESRKNRIYELHSISMSKNSEKASLVNLLNTLKRRKQQIDSEKADSDIRIAEFETKLQVVLKERALIQAKIEQIEATQNNLSIAIKLQNDKKLKTGNELELLKIQYNEAAARKKAIEEMESTYEGYNFAVKFIMKHQERLSGIRGVIAELISVPVGFETAIETALGSALQNIVCEGDEDARRAIEALKENKAGRLTFLPLRSIRSNKVSLGDEIIMAPGFQGLGTDCISFDKEYNDIMDYLLGRVVIVDQLDHAVKMSKKAGYGLRFVTLEGEVINSSGAITGGNYKNNAGNLLERKAEIKRLFEKTLGLSDRCRYLEATLAEIGTSLSAQMENSAALDREHRDAEIRYLNSNNEVAGVETKLAELRENDIKWQRELYSIDQENAANDQIIADMITVAMEADKEREILEQSADESIKNQSDQKILVETAYQEITDLRLALGKTESERMNHVSNIERIQDYIAELTVEKVEREKQLDRLLNSKIELSEDVDVLEEKIAERDAAKSSLEASLKVNQAEKELVVRYIKEVNGKKESLEEALSGIQSQKFEQELKLARNEALVESYKEKLWEEFELSYLQAMDFKKHDFSMASAQRESKDLKNRMKELGEVNIGAIKEYETVSERLSFLTIQRTDLLDAMLALRKIIDDMDKIIRAHFKESFDNIALNFSVAFTELFGGGFAELRLEDENRPLECGIEIVAQPPGKKLQNINLLSGGEKTMTAIALMFAVLKAKPTPFCILDEVEAALDDSNINRFAEYLKNFKDIQFTLVTHQKATMEFADILYGVTMPEQGISKVISLKLGTLND